MTRRRTNKMKTGAEEGTNNISIPGGEKVAKHGRWRVRPRPAKERVRSKHASKHTNEIHKAVISLTGASHSQWNRWTPVYRRPLLHTPQNSTTLNRDEKKRPNAGRRDGRSKSTGTQTSQRHDGSGNANRRSRGGSPARHAPQVATRGC